MPFEFLGVDLETVEGREIFSDTYALTCKHQIRYLDGVEMGDMFLRFTDENPSSAGELLVALRSHKSESSRALAGHLAVFQAEAIINKIDPDLESSTLEKLLLDESRQVRYSVQGHIQELLAKERVSSKIGLLGLRRVLDAYSQAEEIEQAR